VRAKDSSVCAVRTSSQSLDLADENARQVAGGNFKFATGMESEVAFFAREPSSNPSTVQFGARRELDIP
jgi:hypothetical protein